MKKLERGFTLLELLVVIAIISIMAAIIFPVFASARRDGRRAVSTSNLKQCGMALLMYCDDYNGLEDMPSGDVAAQVVLKKMPTCDPSDTWRSSCGEDYGKPLIGSYAYINNFDQPAQPTNGLQWWWRLRLGFGDSVPLLASIFYADPVPKAFHGFSRAGKFIGCAPDLSDCVLPNRVLQFRSDGSVKMVKRYSNQTRVVFDWEGVFYD